MSLKLNGIPLPGKDPRVSVQEQIERGDLSGETSATAGSHRGWTAALITYPCKVAFEEAGALASLRGFWATADDAGEPRAWQMNAPFLAGHLR